MARDRDLTPADPWESPFSLRVTALVLKGYASFVVTGTITHGPDSAYGYNPWQLADDLNAAVERVLEKHGAELDLEFEVA